MPASGSSYTNSNRSWSAMLTLRLIFLLAVIWGNTSNGAPAEKTHPLSRTKRGPGGLLTILEFTRVMRGFCEAIKGITEMLELYPLSAIGDILFNLPIPIPNIRYFDRLSLIDFVQTGLLSAQNLINQLNFFNLNFGKRDTNSFDEKMKNIHDLLTQQMERLNDFRSQGSFEFREQEEYFDPPPGNTTLNLATPSPPPAPGFLLTVRDVFGLQDLICPGIDFVESVFTKSPIAFLHLERLPMPIPDGERPIDFLKAFDLYNITGAVSGLFG